jgi:excisionase family DNA binding protein
MNGSTDTAREGTTMEQPEMGYRLLRVEEVAEILQVSRAFGYQLVQRGELPGVHLGRAVRVRYEAVMHYIEEHECASTTPALGGAR